MKTKQQILEHLAQVGYAKTEAPKIAGWLVAKEITKVGEKVVYTDGEKSFGEFLDWYNESWVDIKKSDKEMFMEWKLENVVFLRQLGSLSMSSDYKEKKLNAYAELYLFSEWVNKFYEKNEYAFLYTQEERLIIGLGGSGSLLGQIYFHSHEAAQRAIDCLGEELIKTALK